MNDKISSLIIELTGSSDIVCYGGKSLVEEMNKLIEWQPMDTAPKDGTPILVECNHDADPYYLEGSESCIGGAKHILTTYGAHCEGLNHVADGHHVVVWGGGFSESDWESGYSCHIPDWWFLNKFDYEIVANPIRWRPI